MDHPSTRTLARYALGEITDESELASFEEHLLECEHCRRMAMAVDLIGTTPEGSEEKPLLHIAAGLGEAPAAWCGDAEPRNVISEMLLTGLDATLVCPRCLAMMRSSGHARVN